MRPKRRHLTRAALALTASAFLILTACNQKTGAAELEAAIAEEIEAATEGRMERFSLADGHVGQPNWVWLEPPLSTDTLRSSDMAASISVIDSHKDDRRLHGNGLELRISSGSAAPNQGLSAQWVDLDDGAGNQLGSINAHALAYGDWMCPLPTLRELRTVAGGSDFTQIGRCSPRLEGLEIEGWNQSTGYAGLADLEYLTWLRIEGSVEVADFPRIEGLEHLTIDLAVDTTANRAAIQAKAN